MHWSDEALPAPHGVTGDHHVAIPNSASRIASASAPAAPRSTAVRNLPRSMRQTAAARVASKRRKTWALLLKMALRQLRALLVEQLTRQERLARRVYAPQHRQHRPMVRRYRFIQHTDLNNL